MLGYTRTFLVGLLIVGCSGASGTDGGPGTDAGGTEAGTDAGRDAGWDGGPWDAGPDAGGLCALDIDLVCPVALPHPGAPCRDGLICEFTDPGGIWTYTCPAGRWEASLDCMSLGGCPLPPFAETCDTPVTDPLTGGIIEIGPGGSAPFRPFMDRESVTPIVGGQGSPMIEYRFRVTRVEAPDCVRAVTTIAAAPIETVSEPRTIHLRCGESLGILTIVPSTAVCPTTPVETTLTVEVVGIGTASVTVLLPPDTFCPLLPG